MSGLEEMRRKQIERKNQFTEVLKQIHSTSNELRGSAEEYWHTIANEESDLSLSRLEDLHNQLLSLQKEKVLFHYSFCSVLILYLLKFL